VTVPFKKPCNIRDKIKIIGLCPGYYEEPAKRKGTEESTQERLGDQLDFPTF
jgi:hypothetical protein